jgi:redox-sensitive bicupin YhaK (pirin superfamily)
MSIQVRPSQERGPTRIDWLDSLHTFSFGHYYDPRHMGFGPLRVINEDRVAPGGGFATHGHANMEIVTVVLEGALAHKDSLGTGSTIRPNDVQRMSAGSGILHSEFNASQSEPVHFLQIWVQPATQHGAPDYAQAAFDPEARRGRLQLWLSPDGADGSLTWRQDARLFGVRLGAGETVEHAFAAGRRGWLQVARGEVEADGILLHSGDGAAVGGLEKIALRGAGSEMAEVLLFDLP